ncbi:hypothetical protein VA7868_03104 [Vibrio aerogenes CECT 7868]|uniref:TadE-like domain-containing protein n=1 Tax=Vibrio aerogenes CECT 7868 TaxID=1216006 RepID=A0A1M5ZRI0_9VIBR|nr:TadE family protein [Vibrio aerogenes]SHI26801.1 hypothetical protein VA7868_03104 [Vibrio aerogenes CECT 7868]
MQQRSQWRIKRQACGIATIEFVLGFMAFWWVCMAWVEMSYMSYVSALSDYAVSEAARIAKLDDSNDCQSEGCQTAYLQLFQSALQDQQSLWARFIDTSDFTFSIQYVKDQQALAQLGDNDCTVNTGESIKECGTAHHSTIAVYRVNYRYQPMFNYFLDSAQLFTREAIVIQEYERDQFEYE